MAGAEPETISGADDNRARSRRRCQCDCHKGSKKPRNWNYDTTEDEREDDDDSDYENIDVAEVKKKKRNMLPRRVVLDVGGQKFSTFYSTLSTFPKTKLGRLTKADPSYDKHRGEYFFDRNPRLFSNILDYYRMGELHFPQDLCGPFIKHELQFWEISESAIAPCCLKNYKEFEEEQHTLELLDSMFGGKQHPDEHCPRTRTSPFFIKWMKNTWLFLEFPSTSVAAQVWAYVYLVLLVSSIIVICLETHQDFRVASDSRNGCPFDMAVVSNSSNSTLSTEDIPTLAPVLLDATNPKIRMYITTDPHPVLRWIDNACTLIFTSELCIRLTVWPNKLKFFWSFFNMIDILAVVPMFIVSILAAITPCFWIERGFVSFYLVMSFVCVFRAVRILKLVKHCRGLQIMYLAMKASLREILLLLLLIIIGTLIFSTMIYFAEFSDEENFTNIPMGFWWSIVTMTTVGYGDITPKTGLGYLVGSLCALTGMLITGLPIPVIANSFHLYYTYAKLKDKLEIQRQGIIANKAATMGFHNHAYEGDVRENGDPFLGPSMQLAQWPQRFETGRYHKLGKQNGRAPDHL